MADALLAGLPRIARAGDETRMRGWLAIAVAAASAAWWAVQWLLDQPLEFGRTAFAALAFAVAGLHVGVLNVRRRVRRGLATARPPGPRVVYETRADAAARRLRLSAAVILTVMVVLSFDGFAGWSGVSAGVVAGVGVAAGVADLWESRQWRAAERARRSELYLLVNANAFVASYGEARVCEVPPETAERARERGLEEFGF